MKLYINACVRPDSRTIRLAKEALIQNNDYVELNLEEMNLQPLVGDTLDKRTTLIKDGALDDPMFALSKQFASAEDIVIAAPYWDGSFPALLKTYLENIYVTGIVSQYGADGRPIGLCKANVLYYVTTAGGPYNPAYSYDYLKDLALNFWGIKKTELLFAEMLDIVGNNPEKILTEAITKYKNC